MRAAPPANTTLGTLRASGFAPRSVREEIRANLLERLRSGKRIFDGVLGYDETVVPAVENALLCGHDLIFLGERGQAKTRMIRQLVSLLDEWIPVVAGAELHDDPLQPITAFGRERVAREGDACEVTWVHRDDRYVEKLATPDVSIADLIGDVDPIKVAEGRSLSDEHTIHFGLLPRTHRGVFCINELPDLTEKVQVGLFNVMEERDVQVKGYRVRLPVDVLVVASANPEDYTSRGRIITPLKDRYAAQIRTHYPKERELELEIARQEAELPGAPGVAVTIPTFMEDIVAELTFQARRSPDVNQASGVSVRMTIANYETLAANAVRRALRSGEPEAVPRISDLDALFSSTSGKIELEYAGGDRSEAELVSDLVRRATRTVFDERCSLDALAPLASAFDEGWNVEVSASMPAPEVPRRARPDPGPARSGGAPRRRRLAGAARVGGGVPARGPASLEQAEQDHARARRYATGSREDEPLQPLGRLAGRVLPRPAARPRGALGPPDGRALRRGGPGVDAAARLRAGGDGLPGDGTGGARMERAAQRDARPRAAVPPRSRAGRAAGALRGHPASRAGGPARAARLRVGAHERLPGAAPCRPRAALRARSSASAITTSPTSRPPRRSPSCSRSWIGCAPSRTSWPNAARASAGRTRPTTRRPSRSASAWSSSSSSRAISPRATSSRSHPRQLRDLLGEDAAHSLVMLRDLESSLRSGGFLRGADPQLTPHAIRRIGAHALAEVYATLSKDRPGPTRRTCGVRRCRARTRRGPTGSARPSISTWSARCSVP
jgi:magnesium chelatase subunit I